MQRLRGSDGVQSVELLAPGRAGVVARVCTLKLGDLAGFFLQTRFLVLSRDACKHGTTE